MSDLVHSIISIPPPFNMIVLIVLIVATAGVVGTIVKQVRKYACHRQELEFKRELLDRGLPVDEIERIVRARGPSSDSGHGCG
jgi:hypothetical protein